MKFKYKLYAVISVMGILIVFIALNFGLNLLERTFRDVDFINLKEYCRQKKLSENYAIVVDYSIPSGKHRFFVCDLKKQEIIASSLCAHGAGHTIKMGNKRHYLLANVALVGEAIMLAMRTNIRK